MAYAPDKTASFVGLERIKGTVGGKHGSLVLQHVGTFANGSAKATLTVISGTQRAEIRVGQRRFPCESSGINNVDLIVD